MFPLWMLNGFGWAASHLRLLGLCALFALALASTVVLYRSCTHRTPKLNVEEVQKAQKAIAVEDRKEMIETLANIAVKEQGIDNSIKAAEEASDKAKRDYSAKTNRELADELEKRLHE